MDDIRSRGVEIYRINVFWPRYEPRRGQYDRAYIENVKEQIDALTARGFKVAIELAVSNPPPNWIWNSTDPKIRPAIFYRNQYGEDFKQTSGNR